MAAFVLQNDSQTSLVLAVFFFHMLKYIYKLLSHYSSSICYQVLSSETAQVE